MRPPKVLPGRSRKAKPTVPEPVGPKLPEPPLAMKKSGSAKARRSAARLAAVQMLYQHAISGTALPAMLRDPARHSGGDRSEGERFVSPDTDLLKIILDAAEAREADIDALVDAALGAQKAARSEPLLRALLRAGTAELLVQPETPQPIVLADFVAVAQAFYAGAEVGLVNAVLDAVARALRRPVGTEAAE